MFTLTCPSCGRAVRAKFARPGARATCPACRKVYTLDARTLAKETESGEVVPVSEGPPVGVAGGGEGGDKRSLRSRKLRARTAAFRRSAESRWRGVRDRLPAWSAGCRPMKLMGVLVLLMVGGIGVLLAILLLPQASEQAGRTAPAATQRPTGSDPASGRTAGGVSERTGTGADLGDGRARASMPPAPPVPGVGPADPPRVGGVGDGMPELRLGSSVIREAYWRRLPEPVEPMRPTGVPNVLLWSARLAPRGEGSGGGGSGGGGVMFSAEFLGDSREVYRSGFLHVQLLNERGLAYAELKQAVPVVVPRLGLRLRLPVPSAYLEGYGGLVAEFTPLRQQVVEDGAPLEMVESAQRILSRGGGASVMRLVVHNPHAFSVVDPEVVVEVLTPGGWPLGQWRGRLSGSIEAGGVLAFRAALPLPEDSTPGRAVVRGYGHRSGGVGGSGGSGGGF